MSNNFEFAQDYPIHRPLITTQGDVYGDVFDLIEDKKADIAYKCRLEQVERGNFLENLAEVQFQEGASNFAHNPAYQSPSGCSWRYRGAIVALAARLPCRASPMPRVFQVMSNK